MRELIRSMGDTKAIIISTHILEEVDAVCDRTIIIDHGKIVSDGTPAQLHARSPEHNAVALKVLNADADRAVAILTGLPEVAEVAVKDKTEERTSLVARPRNGQFIADLVASTLRANQIETFDVTNNIGQLDDVFRAVTTLSGG